MECLCCSSKSLDTRLVNGRNHIANMGAIRSQVAVYLVPRSLSITILCRKVRFRQFSGVEDVCLVFSSRWIRICHAWRSVVVNSIVPLRTVARLVLFKLKDHISVQLFFIYQLLLENVFLFTFGFELDSHFLDQSLMVLVHLIKFKRLSPEPVSFLLHINKSCFLFGLDTLNIRLFFQIAHVFLDDVHFLLKRCQEVTFVLVDYAFYVSASILYKQT